MLFSDFPWNKASSYWGTPPICWIIVLDFPAWDDSHWLARGIYVRLVHDVHKYRAFVWLVKSIKYVLEEDGLRSRVQNYILKTFRSVWIILTKEDDCHVDSCCFKKWWVILSMFLIFWGPGARCRRCPRLWSAFFLCAAGRLEWARRTHVWSWGDGG